MITDENNLENMNKFQKSYLFIVLYIISWDFYVYNIDYLIFSLMNAVYMNN